MSKGSTPRPVDKKTWDKNWDHIFNHDKELMNWMGHYYGSLYKRKVKEIEKLLEDIKK
tara:strand:- start:507 stop:680 length:174 start_codon:yes stop_codon:yes gene_type:complete